MSYHRDYHWFDFDDHHLDMMYPMTDLDKQIAKYGAKAVLNKGKKQVSDRKTLEMVDTDHSLGWVDFSTIIAGKTTFTLTYSLKDDKWYASIKDGYKEALCLDFDVCDETAHSLIDSDEYMELKNLNGEYKKSKGQV